MITIKKCLIFSNPILPEEAGERDSLSKMKFQFMERMIT